MPVPTHLTPKDIARFRRFELIAHLVVEGLMTGLHKSPYKGFAIEFAEHRQYTPGDDLKHLDWKILGKLDRYYIKQYEEDTSLRAYLVLDASGSMNYQSGQFSKFDYARFACSVLAYILLQQQDSVGLITLDSQILDHLPPRSTRQQFKAILDTMGGRTPGNDTNLGNVLHSLANMLKRRALIVIVSDFLDNVDDITLALNHFAHKKHEVILFQVLDRKEAEFPFSDMTRFESLESESFVLTDPLRLKKEYLIQFRQHQTVIRRTCHQLRVELAQMFTDQPFEQSMARYLAGRLKQR